MKKIEIAYFVFIVVLISIQFFVIGYKQGKMDFYDCIKLKPDKAIMCLF